jgi:hypothetical protein
MLMVAGFVGALNENRIAAWNRLFSGQADDGSFPGPLNEASRSTHDAEAHPGMEVAATEEASWKRFMDDYHTTLVVLLALRTRAMELVL